MLESSIKKIIFALITQALILVCSAITSLLLPKYMGAEMYGYWQIYYFYLNYINLITLGYNDGLVLQYGGRQQKELPVIQIKSGNILIIFFSIVIAILGIIVISGCRTAYSNWYIFTFLFISMPCVCIFNVITSIFLAVNKQEVYNRLNLLSRFLTTIGYCFLLIVGMNTYGAMIKVDFLVRLIMTIVCIYIGRSFILGKRFNLRIGWHEVKTNCAGGIFITMGALCSAFAPVAGRVVLEHQASIYEYALFSFAMSVLALVVTFTNVAGMVFFPILKTIESNKLQHYYHRIKNVYYSLVFYATGCYIPAVLLIKCYLTEYQDVLRYLYLIIAICIPMGKLQVVLTPYMKAYRLERQYFIANLIGALAVIATDWLVYQFWTSTYAVALTTLLVYESWTLIFEFYVQKKIEIDSWKSGREILLLAFFIVMAFPQNIGWFSIGYCIGGIIIGYINRNVIKRAV